MYEVTIVATDDDPLDTGAEGQDHRWVVVHNVQEDGEVVFTAGDDGLRQRGAGGAGRGPGRPRRHAGRALRGRAHRELAVVQVEKPVRLMPMIRQTKS